MIGYRHISSTLALTEVELRKLRHDPSEVLVRSVQPALWLLIFGEVLNVARAIPTGPFTYLQFLTPGILAQSVMFIAIFYGLAIVWERDFGILNKLLSTPVPRSAIVMGKALSAGARGIFQALVILLLAWVMRVPLYLGAANIAGVFIVIVLFGICIASLSILLASLLKTRERVMGIAQAIIMPLFFASNAIYPVEIMPRWLQAVVIFNPLTYVVDAMRALLVTGDYSKLPLDVIILSVTTVVFVALATVAFKRVID
ncbi:MAG: ABC transporter permease [Chloroflexi bacterium]|nr:ABC transporter permease [Chloroflexota bacterium]